MASQPAHLEQRVKLSPTARLLRMGGCFSHLQRKQASRLFKAVKQGSIQDVRKLLSNGADINAQDPSENGRTSLHLAVYHSAPLVRLLLLNGADVNAPDREGSTPLHLAVVHQGGNLRILDALLTNCAALDPTSKNGDTILHAAARGGSANTIRLLLEYGAPFSTATSSARTPLETALDAGNMAAARELLKIETWLGPDHWVKLVSELRARYPDNVPLNAFIEELGPADDSDPPLSPVLSRDQASARVAQSALPRFVEIARRADGFFGFEIVGGSDQDLVPHIVFEPSAPPSFISGEAYPGDEVREINSTTVTVHAHTELVKAVKDSGAVVRLMLVPSASGLAPRRHVSHLLCDPSVDDSVRKTVAKRLSLAGLLAANETNSETCVVPNSALATVGTAEFKYLEMQGLVERQGPQQNGAVLFRIKAPAEPSEAGSEAGIRFYHTKILCSGQETGLGLAGGSETHGMVLVASAAGVRLADAGQPHISPGDALVAIGELNVVGLAVPRVREIIAARTAGGSDVVIPLLLMSTAVVVPTVSLIKNMRGSDKAMGALLHDMRTGVLTSSVPYTTRKQRDNEVDGVDYHFVSADAFRAAIDRREFFEWAEDNGVYYGTKWHSDKQPLARRSTLLEVLPSTGSLLVRPHQDRTALITDAVADETSDGPMSPISMSAPNNRTSDATTSSSEVFKKLTSPSITVENEPESEIRRKKSSLSVQPKDLAKLTAERETGGRSPAGSILSADDVSATDTALEAEAATLPKLLLTVDVDVTMGANPALLKLRKALEDRLKAFDGERTLQAEYFEVSRIASQATESETVTVAKANPVMNRYIDILPYDRNRVVLSDTDGGLHDYINASYISAVAENDFIAAQGPTPRTINDFWRMVWQSNTKVIVMLAERFEDGREKCAKYWPDHSATEQYGKFQVTCAGESTSGDLTQARLIMTCDKFPGEERVVQQLRCRAWQDHGVTSEDSVMAVRVAVRKIAQGSSDPVLVHCSAGVGRTGCFIAADAILTAIERCPKDIEDSAAAQIVDVFAMAVRLRKSRPRMIQTLAQYRLVYSIIDKYLDSRVEQTEDSDD
uniref:protein-tyrosine-phosphatase n=1 Tax=Monosiga ovata TaxID=81526 RepID=E5RKD8_9EUKA|nr:protein tyrosine phosphatase [Monosiga ovata]